MGSLWRSMRVWQKTACVVVACALILFMVLRNGGLREGKGGEAEGSVTPVSSNTPASSAGPQSSSIPLPSADSSMSPTPTADTTPGVSSLTPALSAAPSSTAIVSEPSAGAPSSGAASVSPLPSQSASFEAQTTVLTEQYQGRLNTLRNGCMDRVNNLVTEVIASLKENGEDEAAIATLQQTYLPKIMNEEASCDKQFSELITEAEQKGVAASDVTNWKGQYEKTKEDARNQALQMLLSAFPIKSRSE